VISVRPATCGADWDAFKRVPRTIYRRDPYWIPGELVDIDDVLADPGPHVRQRRLVQGYVAFDGRTAAGRVVAIADHAYMDHLGARMGFFGFYESVDDDAVAFALLDAVNRWAAERSITYICGPMSPSMVYSAGMLVSGFGQPPLVGMPHNPDYYAGQLERWGMNKVKDLHSYLVPDPYTLYGDERFARIFRMRERWRAQSRITFRSTDPKHFERDVETVRLIYNAAFGKFWGFAPLTNVEMLELAAAMRPVLDDDLMVFAELDDEPVGFLMAIPDVNQAAIRAARLRVGLFRDLLTLWHWKGPNRSRTVRNARVDMLMVRPDCPDPGTAALLIDEMIRRIHKKGYTSIEGAPVLEDGSWIRPFKRVLSLEPHRVYRVYGREVDSVAT
jgi:GNAT superfamily N-acetyltransferase